MDITKLNEEELELLIDFVSHTLDITSIDDLKEVEFYVNLLTKLRGKLTINS
jgi:hypothetical protein